MSDLIHIKGLSFFAKHGVFAEERTLGQKFIIHLTLKIDLSNVGAGDDLTQGLCYKTVIENVISFATTHIFKTIEGLAEHLAHKLLCDYKKLISVELTVEKPHAAIDAVFDTISITILRDHISSRKNLDRVKAQKLERNLEPV